MTVIERLDKILSYSGLNAKSFSEKIGLNRPQAIYDIQNGKTKDFSSSMRSKILSVFSELNSGWLATGEGEMLKSDPANSVNTASAESETITMPRDAWNVIQKQADSLSSRDRQIDDLIQLIKEQQADKKTQSIAPQKPAICADAAGAEYSK